MRGVLPLRQAHGQDDGATTVIARLGGSLTMDGEGCERWGAGGGW